MPGSGSDGKQNMYNFKALDTYCESVLQKASFLKQVVRKNARLTAPSPVVNHSVF